MFEAIASLSATSLVVVLLVLAVEKFERAAQYRQTVRLRRRMQHRRWMRHHYELMARIDTRFHGCPR